MVTLNALLRITQRDKERISLFSMGYAVQKNKNHIQLGFRRLMSKGILVRERSPASWLLHIQATSGPPGQGMTRHEKKPVALSRKIATKMLARAARVPGNATIP
ncbi:unnamed protein product [Caretta caretta]